MLERIAMNIIHTVLIYFLYLWGDNNHSYIAYREHIIFIKLLSKT